MTESSLVCHEIICHRSHLLTRLSFAMAIISSNLLQQKHCAVERLCSKVTRHVASLICSPSTFPSLGAISLSASLLQRNNYFFSFSFGKQIIIIITLRIFLYSKLSYYSDKCLKPGLFVVKCGFPFRRSLYLQRRLLSNWLVFLKKNPEVPYDKNILCAEYYKNTLNFLLQSCLQNANSKIYFHLNSG